MTATSVAFERRVERIHRLLETEGSTITWNDRVPDPDNPAQPRQIDISISRDGKLTIVECRIHKSPQDVTWIEELFGRRASLRADAVIAVSASGFTEGAIAKAKHFGIILRDFNTLTQEEVLSWGRPAKVQLHSFRFSRNTLLITLPRLPTLPVAITGEDDKEINWRIIFNELLFKFGDRPELRRPGAVADVTAVLSSPLFANKIKASSVTLTTKMHHLIREVSLVSVVAYADPIDDGARSALIGSYDLASSEIVEVADTVSIVADLTGIPLPPHSLFYTMNWDFGRPVLMRDMTFIGAADAMKFDLRLQFDFRIG